MMNTVSASNRTLRNRRRRQRKAQLVAQAVTAVQPAPPGQGRSRNARRRRGGRANGIPRLSDFVHCVVNPFGHAGSLTGVPDRFNGVSVVIENRTSKTMSGTGSRDMYFLITDWPGVNLNFVRQGATTAAQLTDLIAQFEYEPATMSYSTLSAGFEKYRTISMAVRILPIGAQWKMAGLISACLIPVDVIAIGAALVGGAVNRVISLDNIPVSIGAIMAQPDSVQFRASEGIMVVSKHSGGDSWNFSDLHQNCAITVGEDLKPSDKGIPVDLSSKTLYNNMQTPWIGSDGNSYAILVRINANNGDCAYLVETVHCMELLPQSGPYKSLARPSPPVDPMQLDAVSRIQRDMPAGCSVTQESGWMTFLKGAANVGLQLADRFLGLNLGGAAHNRVRVPAITW